MPTRIQRSRAKGSKLPAGCVCVTRPGPFGNPFKPSDYLGDAKSGNNKDLAVKAFRGYAEQKLREETDWLAPLRGKDLACWCAIGSPCHGDVLLELANQEK